jgi:hypothetical protein
MKKLFILVFMALSTLSAWAFDFSVDGIYYNHLDGNNVEVTYRGDRYYDYYNEYAGEVIIPSTVTYNGTTYSVTSIGDYAFYGCSSLPVENNLRYADTYLVEAVNKTLSTYSIKEGTKWVGDHAFANRSSLTSMTIPDSVTSIGDAAFYYCFSLTSVTIGESVTSIGEDAFAYCSSLTSITCKAATPPTGGSDAFYWVSKSIPVYVPCGCIEAYKAVSGWEDFTNIQELLAEYSIEVNVNDTIMGSA